MFRAYVKLTRGGLKVFLRDRPSLFWSFFFPLFFIVLFGSVFSSAGDGSARKFPVGLVMPDHTRAAAWVPEVFGRVFTIHSGTLATEQQSLQKGDVRAVLVFPSDFGQNLISRQPSNIRVLYDPSQQQISPIVLGIIRQILEGMDNRISGSPTLLEEQDVAVQSGPTSSRQLKTIDFVLPGILAMTIMQLGLFTAIPLINLREKGILKRYRATPLTRPTFVAAQVSQRLLISLAQTGVIIGIGMALYKFHVVGSWLMLLAVVVTGVLTFIAIGAVLSALAKTQESAAPVVQLVMMPMMFLTGLFFPLDLLPPVFRTIGKLFPTTYLADMLRSVMLAQPSSYHLPVDFAIMGAWLAVALIVASRTFRWE